MRSTLQPCDSTSTGQLSLLPDLIPAKLCPNRNIFTCNTSSEGTPDLVIRISTRATRRRWWRSKAHSDDGEGKRSNGVRRLDDAAICLLVMVCEESDVVRCLKGAAGIRRILEGQTYRISMKAPQ